MFDSIRLLSKAVTTPTPPAVEVSEHHVQPAITQTAVIATDDDGLEVVNQ